MADFLFKGIFLAGFAAVEGVKHLRFRESSRITFSPCTDNDLLEITSGKHGGAETYRIWDIYLTDNVIVLDNRIHERSSAIEDFLSTRPRMATIDFEMPNCYDKGAKWIPQESSSYPSGYGYGTLLPLINLVLKHTFDDEIVKRVEIKRTTGEKTVKWWKDYDSWYNERPSLTDKHVLVDNRRYNVEGKQHTEGINMRITTGPAVKELLKWI
jgi:hypothetical protein